MSEHTEDCIYDGSVVLRCTCALAERKRIATLERELAEARAKVEELTAASSGPSTR